MKFSKVIKEQEAEAHQLVGQGEMLHRSTWKSLLTFYMSLMVILSQTVAKFITVCNACWAFHLIQGFMAVEARIVFAQSTFVSDERTDGQTDIVLIAICETTLAFNLTSRRNSSTKP